MKYIQQLVLNDHLNSDSLKGVQINEIQLLSYTIFETEPQKLLKFFNIIFKNKDTIKNGPHLLAKIISTTGRRLSEVILYQKKTDSILEEIISNSIYEIIKHILNCKKFQIKTNLKIDEKKIIEKEDPFLIIEYIREIKKERFIEAEEKILNSTNLAIQYCAEYIKEPWKELEKKIEDTNVKMLYFDYIYKIIVPFYKKKFKGQNIRSLIQKNYPDYEKQIMNAIYQIENILPVYTYSKEIIEGRWLEFEKMVEDRIKSGGNFNRDDCHDFFSYMSNIYPGRWKTAEPYFINLKEGYPLLKKFEDYINQKVIPEYKEKLKTFEDLEKYKDEFNMWDKLMEREIIWIFNPVYTFIKLRDLVYHYDKKIVQKLFKQYFPLNYKNYIEPII